MIRLLTGLLVLACSFLCGAASVPTEGIVLRTNVVLAPDDMLIWTGSYWTNVPRSSIGGSGGGTGSVSSVGLSTSISGLSVGNSPVTGSGTMTLTGTVGLLSGGTGATNAAGARAELGLGSVATHDLSEFPTLGGDNTWTGTNHLSALDVDILSASNLVLQLVPYAPSWDGSSNAVSRDAIYDLVQTLAPLVSPSFTTPTLGAATATSVTMGGTNVTAALALKAPIASPSFTGDVLVGTTNVAGALAAKAPLVSPSFTTPTLGVASATSVTLGATNVAAELALKAPLVSPSFTTPTLGAATATSVTMGGTNVTAALALKAPAAAPSFTGLLSIGGTVSVTQSVLQPYSTVTNYVIDPTFAYQQVINATNLVVKFLHATNATAGAQCAFLILSGTNASVSVELPSNVKVANTNKFSMGPNQVLPISVICWSPNNNTNVLATVGRPGV